ncbi:uncharacterized protein BX664DRAFT_111732 [Halteromyces radiatus]|uniref:uncharacterized protein n=1 Tax=Halteromyces radiatus TaxID=101107 RepID=UPI00221F5889|nr:uncharacterized protein BX664DRAFT_111732 [Halteromyces radiatus]KAI8093646.1 hypothetical protein BX664DRAFT_111732 [Halteromyces radiatus]
MMNIDELFNIRNKVCLITGGGRGIGLMIAKGFVSAGAKVYISSRNGDVCHQVAKELTEQGPGQCFAIAADLQKLEDIQHLVVELGKREHHLDVLINNSGANWAAPIADYPDAGFQKVVNLNLTRVFSLTQACLPLLRANPTLENPARIINIGSISGETVPKLEMYAYSASKAAVHHLTRHLAARLGSEGILVNAVAPGSFPTKMMAETLKREGDHILKTIPVGRFGQDEDLVGTCIYLTSRAGAYTTGAVIVVDGGALQSSRM